jgi:hypothetical protein
LLRACVLSFIDEDGIFVREITAIGPQGTGHFRQTFKVEDHNRVITSVMHENKDGSWGDPDEENIRTRCHTTWTAIDGLRTFAWRGRRLSPEVKSMLK